MSADLWRLAGALVLGLMLGGLVDQPLLGGILALLSLHLYQQHLYRRLLAWLHGHGNSAAPSQSGLVNATVQQVDSLRKSYRSRQRRLTEMLDRIHESVGALPDAMVILDADGQIEWANRSAAGMLGVRWPQDEGHKLDHLIRHPTLVASLQAGAGMEEEQQLELISIRKPGVVLEMRIMPRGYRQRLLFARDITVRRGLEAMRRRFIADASHELRTPLTIFSSTLEALEQEAQPLPKWTPLLRQMRIQTGRMDELIKKLLELSVLESRTLEEHPAQVEVCVLLKQLHEELEVAGVKQKIQIECDSSQRIQGHADELYSAFSNLVRNALQHTPEDGRIWLRWSADAGGAFMEVEDNGVGIPAEHLDRLTERFYRVDRSRSRESGGTGLGLSIVQQILQRHDASLHIESIPGHGSKFRCHFPPERIIAA